MSKVFGVMSSIVKLIVPVILFSVLGTYHSTIVWGDDTPRLRIPEIMDDTPPPSNQTGRDPKVFGCESGARSGWRTLASTSTNGQATRNSKIGLKYSSSCKTVWLIYEAPVDAIAVLEDDAGKVMSRSRSRRAGVMYRGAMVDFSGRVRACLTLPFGQKECTKFATIPF